MTASCQGSRSQGQLSSLPCQQRLGGEEGFPGSELPMTQVFRMINNRPHGAPAEMGLTVSRRTLWLGVRCLWVRRAAWCQLWTIGCRRLERYQTSLTPISTFVDNEGTLAKWRDFPKGREPGSLDFRSCVLHVELAAFTLNPGRLIVVVEDVQLTCVSPAELLHDGRDLLLFLFCFLYSQEI